MDLLLNLLDPRNVDQVIKQTIEGHTDSGGEYRKNIRPNYSVTGAAPIATVVYLQEAVNQLIATGNADGYQGVIAGDAVTTPTGNKDDYWQFSSDGTFAVDGPQVEQGDKLIAIADVPAGGKWSQYGSSFMIVQKDGRYLSLTGGIMEGDIYMDSNYLFLDDAAKTQFINNNGGILNIENTGAGVRIVAKAGNEPLEANASRVDITTAGGQRMTLDPNNHWIEMADGGVNNYLILNDTLGSQTWQMPGYSGDVVVLDPTKAEIYNDTGTKVFFKALNGGALFFQAEANIALQAGQATTGALIELQSTANGGHLKLITQTEGALQLPNDLDPDTNVVAPQDGMIKYDTTDDEFRAYVNGAWTRLALIGDVTASDQLSEILAKGNTTGANDIIVSAGQKLDYAGNINIADSLSYTLYSDGFGFYMENPLVPSHGVRLQPGTNVMLTYSPNSSVQVSDADIKLYNAAASYKLYDGANYAEFDVSGIGGNYTYTFPGSGGTIALTSDITLATLGLDADLATFALPANTTISAFGATLVGDADAATARTTLGLTGGTQITQTVKVSLTALQVQSLNTVPVQALAAPGAGKAYMILGAFATLTYGTAAFTSAALQLQFDTATDIYANTGNSFLVATGNASAPIVPNDSIGVDDALIANEELMITANADSGVGDSTVDVYITYVEVTI